VQHFGVGAALVTTEGFDASSGPLRYEEAAALAFAFLKVTDGVGSLNRWLDVLSTGLRGAGMKRLGGYHFLRIRHGRAQDADEQAREFVAHRVAHCVDSMPGLLDVELGETSSSNRIASRSETSEAISLFVDTYRTLTGDDLWGYSSPGEIGVMGLATIPAFTALPLIVADYEAHEHDPLGFNVVGWQYRGNVLAYGGCVDLIRLHGDVPAGA
jgi:hypothetical protein